MNVLVWCDIFRTREQNAEQLATVKAEHHREIERLLASHALEHSSSKVAELANQVNTQEVFFYEFLPVYVSPADVHFFPLAIPLQ